MDVTVPKKDLLRLVGRCQGVADKKSTMPALVQRSARADGPTELRVAATDLYLAVSGTVNGVEVKKGGSVAVPAKDLFERVKMMPEGPIQIATQRRLSTTLKAAASARRYTLRGMPGEDFPAARRARPRRAHARSSSSSLCPSSSHAPTSRSPPTRRARTEQRALRVGRRSRAHGDDRRPPPVEDGGARRRAGRPRRRCSSRSRPSASSAGSATRRAPKPSKEGEDAEASLITQSGPNAFFQSSRGMTLLGQARRRAVPAVLAGHSADAAIARSARRALPSPTRSAPSRSPRAIAPAASSSRSPAAPCASPARAPESGDGFDEVPVDYAGAEDDHRLQRQVLPRRARRHRRRRGRARHRRRARSRGDQARPPRVDEQSYIAVVMPMRI